MKKSAPDLKEMLVHSGGKRQVPVIVEDGTATIGFGHTPEGTMETRTAQRGGGADDFTTNYSLAVAM